MTFGTKHYIFYILFIDSFYLEVDTLIGELKSLNRLSTLYPSQWCTWAEVIGEWGQEKKLSPPLHSYANSAVPARSQH